MIYPNPKIIRPFILLSLLIFVLSGCGGQRKYGNKSPAQERALRPFYEVIVSQKKISELLRENCLQLKDSLETVNPLEKEHYTYNLQKADSLFERVEAIIVSLNEATTFDNDLEKFPLNQLLPLHDSLTAFESHLFNSQCKQIDSSVYFSNNMEDLRELYLYTPNEALFALLTKIQADVYLVLRNHYSCEMTLKTEN